MSSVPRWQCTVCGLIVEGPAPPKMCPKCGARSNRFIKIN
ncbi:rubredoxin [Syntrophotalea carbinolica DSM 2380]|uniref:Rubredoxin n=1 Tax=Syntrophotalea carbinolica (strain DSM 2380 / NBRC 103641 / GraBd1) TaxID=338963 RepID=Q0C6G0_SYNC1|nr:rubredoxin [Syntrophotalea carbinolica DSM 2380]